MKISEKLGSKWYSDATEKYCYTSVVLSSQIRQRELSDNLQVRRKEAEIEKRAEEIAELEEELGGLDVTNLNREMTRLNSDQEKLLAEVSALQEYMEYIYRG